MNFFKRLVNLFSKEQNNNKENDTESLSQPQKSPMTPEKKRRIRRRIITWLIIILIIGTIIGVIVYFATAKHEDEISVKQATIARKVNPNDANKTSVALSVTDFNDKTYSVDQQAISNAQVYIVNEKSYLIIVKSPENVRNIAFTIQSTGIETYKIGASEFDLKINQNAPQEQKEFFALIEQKAEYRKPAFNAQLIISPLTSFIIFGLLFYFMMRMSKAQTDSIYGNAKQNAKLTKSSIKFTDVAGIAEVKNELIEIVDFLKQPRKYVAAGARIPKGVILYGPPGTGKTLIAKAVAGEANVPFFQTTGSSFEDTFVGVGARRVRELFEKARKSAPAIVFIDEIDSVAKKRGNSLNAVQDQTINQLLAELDGFETTSGVIVMAATNRLDTLDDAILRPGRFDRHISVNLPDIKEREQILRIHSRNKNLSTKVSLEDIARRTAGFSGAQLENTLNEAALLSVRENSPSIAMRHLDEAIDRVIAGPSRPNKVISEREREQIAYHEAGHALVGLYNPGVDVVQKITIVARGRAAGYTLQTPEKNENILQRKNDLLARVRVTLGGRAAEEIIYGVEEVTTGASNDFYKITNVVRAMVGSFGMTDVGLTQHIPTEGVDNPYRNNYSEETSQRIDKEVEFIIQREYALVKELIQEHRQELDLIVETLLELETILKPQIDYIHEHKKLPPEVYESRNKRNASQPTTNIKEATVVEDNKTDDSKDNKEPLKS